MGEKNKIKFRRIRNMLLLFSVFAGIAFFIADSFSAGETSTTLKREGVFAGFADTYVETASYSTPPQYSRNNGTKTNLRVDRSGGSSLVKIDLSSIPANSSISSAKLKLYNYTSATATRRIKLHSLLKDWDEGNQNGDDIDASGERGATADHAFSYYSGEGTNVVWGQRGLLSGTDYAAAEAGYMDVIGVGWYEVEVTAQVQDWIRNSSGNFGFFLKDFTGYVAGNPDHREFYSSEYSDQNLRPALEVTYNPDTPLANAGSDIEDFEWDGLSSLQLDGSGSSNGSGEIFSWSVVSKAYGSNVTPSAISPNNSTGAISPNFTPDVAGEYTLRLTVTNTLGYSAFDDVYIRVLSIPVIHPRIYLTPEKLQFLRSKKDANTADWARLKSYADGGGLNSMIEQAFMYQVMGDVAYGNRGVTALMNMIATNPAEFDTIGLAYDWLHPLLTSQQKTDIINFLKTKVDGKWTDTLIPWHNYNAGNTLRIGIAGLATYGDNPDAQNWIDHARYTRFRDLMLAGIQANGMGGGWPEGTGYEYSALRLFRYADVVFTATGERLFDSHQWFKDYLSYAQFSELPQKKNLYGDYMESPQIGDMERGRPSFYSYRRLLAEFAMDFFPDMTEAKRLQWYVNRTPVVANTMFAWEEFLKYDPDLPEIAPTSLSYLAQGTGRIFLRSEHGNLDSTHIGFYAGDHFTYHQDMAQGSFTIYKQGDLAIKSGIYDSYGDTNATSHLLAYNARTISSNSMLVCKPDEIFDSWRAGTDGINDCGQTSDGWNSGVSPALEDWQTDPDYDTADIDFFKDTDDFAYIKSDITNAYNPNKLSDFKREMVYLRPDGGEEFVVTFDRVASIDASYEKRWLLHFLNEPTIEGNVTNISLGEDEYDGSLVMADADTGRLLEKALLPKNKKIKKIGGRIKGTVTTLTANSVTASAANFAPNSLVGNTLSFTNRYGIFNRQYPITSNTATTVTVDTSGYENFTALGIQAGDIFSVGKDYWVEGKNYPATHTDYEDDYGEYRIEVIPTTPALQDNFLNVMQPTSTSTSQMSATTLIEGEGLQGTFINASVPRVVIFSDDENLLTSASYQASYSGATTGKHLLLNVENGIYDVYRDANLIQSDAQVTEEVLYFTATGGTNFQVVQTGQLPDPTVPLLSGASNIATTKNATPSFTFTSTEEGTITYGGSCWSSDTSVTTGENTIILNNLNIGTYSDCTLTVTDSSSNASTPLAIPTFHITYQGDIDLDKDVDIFDYNTLLTNFGTSIQGDPDRDNDWDIFDYGLLIGDFGESF